MHDNSVKTNLKAAIARACRNARMYKIPYIVDYEDMTSISIYPLQTGLRRTEQHDFVFIGSRRPNPTKIIDAMREGHAYAVDSFLRSSPRRDV